MPQICPICAKPLRSRQAAIQCTTCQRYIHHNNQLNCSKITDSEFQIHVNDPDREWKCDCCVSNENFKSLLNLPHYHPTKEIYETKKPKTAIFNSAKNNHSDFISKCSELGFFLTTLMKLQL